MMRIWRSHLDLTLIAVAIVSVAAIVLGHEDPFARQVLCGHVACPHWSNSHVWQKIAYDLGMGSIVSLFFYVLVVRIPDRRKRLHFKRNYRRQYEIFKEDCVADMLMIADGTFEWGFHRELVDQKKFEEYFKQDVAPGEDRWDRLHNRLDEGGLQRIITHLEVFREATVFVLSNIEVRNDDTFAFLQRLTRNMWTMAKSTTDYDSKKSLLNFLWDVFAGFSIVTGRRDYDMVARAIDQI
jgi:hypothetical protein